MSDQTCPECGGTGKIKPNMLKVLREKHGLKQADVARSLGVGQPAYSAMESNWPKIGWKHSRTLREMFNVSLDQLAGRVPLDQAPNPKSIAASKRRRHAVARKNRKVRS